MQFGNATRLWSLGAVACMSFAVVQAQTVTGSVTGTVLDASGAAVPNAEVAAVNVTTGVRTNATSNDAGVYSIRFLPIGSYTVEVHAQGFAPLTTPQFQLEISQIAKIDAHVSVNASTTVEVTAAAQPILDTSDGTI